MNKWPMKVACYGRRYEVPSQADLDVLIPLLVERKLALANRYRVGDSWPRGTRKAKQKSALAAEEPTP